MNLETITKRLKIISDLQAELNKLRGLYDESLENDSQYQKLQEEAQKVKEETTQKKEKIMSNPTLKSMDQQMKELRNDITENKEVLAQELVDYYKESGSNEITDEEGNVKRIKFSARLVNG